MIRILVLLFLTSFTIITFAQKKNISICINHDVEGKKINAHSGGILFFNNTYYWFGEYKGDSTYLNLNVKHWECFRADHKGVSCYSSKNLSDWKFEGVVLSPSESPDHDLHRTNVLERPKVIYNQLTKQFVMWMHVDDADYKWAKAGVAVSDSPTGPFRYLGAIKPNGQNSKDMTLFQDDDGKAYLIYSSEGNSTMHICLLTDDYLRPSNKFVRIFENMFREAPAMFKHSGKYFLITSGCTGWSPNKAMYAVSDSIFGPYKIKGNPCKGKDSKITFGGQSTFVFQVNDINNLYVAMFDRWNKEKLIESEYIWIPFSIDSLNEKVRIRKPVLK